MDFTPYTIFLEIYNKIQGSTLMIFWKKWKSMTKINNYLISYFRCTMILPETSNINGLFNHNGETSLVIFGPNFGHEISSKMWLCEGKTFAYFASNNIVGVHHSENNNFQSDKIGTHRRRGTFVDSRNTFTWK